MAVEERDKLGALLSRVEAQAAAVKGCVAANKEASADLERRGAEVRQDDTPFESALPTSVERSK